MFGIVHKIDIVTLLSDILNLKGYHNRMTGSKLGWANPNQNLLKLYVSPCFARVQFCSPVFCPFFARFCLFFARFRPILPIFSPVSPRFCLKMPVFCPSLPGFAQFRPVRQVRSVLPKFARICSFLFAVRMCSLPKPNSKVPDILLNRWILHIGGVALGWI